MVYETAVGAGYGSHSYHHSYHSAGYLANQRLSPASAGSDASSSPPLVQVSELHPANAYSSGLDADGALYDSRKLNTPFTPFSARGWINAIALAPLVFGLLMLHLGYQMYDAVGHPAVAYSGYSPG